MVLFFACGNRQERKFIDSIDDLKGEKVVVIMGSTYDQFLEENYPEIEAVRVESAPNIVPALQSGQSDAALLDGNLAKAIQKEHPEFQVLSDTIFAEHFGVAFYDEKMRNDFNIFLAEKQKNGELTALINKWIDNYENAEMPLFHSDGENGELIIGVEPITPFVMFRANEYVGIELELMYEFAAQKQLKPVVKAPGFAAMITGVAAKKFDVACGGITITEERKQSLLFSDVFYTSKASLLVNAARLRTADATSATAVTQLSDMNGETVAVLNGTIHDIYLEKNYPEITLFRVEAEVDLIPAVQTGRAKAAFTDAVLGESFNKEIPDITAVNVDCLSSHFGFGFNDEKLRDAFNRYLAEKKASGALETMTKKWMDDHENAEMPHFPKSGTNGTITLNMVPSTGMAFLCSQEYCGLEIELISGFAAQQNKSLIIQVTNFPSLIASVASGKADVICGRIAITEERKQEILFSDPYYESKSALFIKKSEELTAENRKIGVFIGSSAEKYISEKYPDNDILRYEGVNNLVTALLHNACDVITLDDLNKREVMKTYPQITCLEEGVFQTTIHVIAPKQKRALMNDFNRFLNELKAAGTLDEILNRWGNGSNAEMPHIENSGKNGTILIATEGATPPYNFIQNGKLAGIDIELVLRYAAHIGKKAEFVMSNFNGVLAAVTANKVDLGAAFISRTDERAEKMCFSNPYNTVDIGFYGIEPINEENNWWASIKASFYNNLVKEKRYLLILDGLKATIIISLLSVLLGTILAAFVCFAKMSKSKLLRSVATVYIDILRGVPQVVLLMIMFYLVFASSQIDGVWVAAITFAMNFSAYVAEMFRTSIEGVDKGQREAGIAMGFTNAKTFRLIVAPQAFKRVLPVFKGEVISLVKMTSIVGYIAVQDLTKAGDIIRSRTFDAFFPLVFIAVLYFLLSWGLTSLLSLTEKKRK